MKLIKNKIKKFILLATAIGFSSNSFSQNILVNMPIDPNNLFNDISDYKNEVTHPIYPTPTYKQNELQDDSSAIYLGTRQFLEINPNIIIGFQEEYLTFSMKIKFENNLSKVGSVLLFGQNDNIGLMFDHENQTLFDVEKLLSYKLDNLDSWLNVKLSYLEDSTVQLVINDNIVQEAKRTSNNLLNNSTIGIGAYDTEYAYARFDSVKVETKTKKTQSLVKIIKENTSVYPNPAKSQIFVKNNLNKVLSIELFDVQGKLLATKKSNNLNIEAYKSGIYFLKINYENISLKKRFLKN